MSADAHVFGMPELIVSSAQEAAESQVGVLPEASGWNREDFAREQIRSLVQRVFLASGKQPVKQVVFSAAEPQLDVAKICEHVARALAVETHAHVAIVAREPGSAEMAGTRQESAGSPSIKSCGRHLTVNLWRVPQSWFRGVESGTGLHWLSCLAELRNEFEYSIIQGPAAGTSSGAALLGQLADGIILVLGAHSTRRATARKIKETLEGANCRILGTVLSERTFPIPERIYRQL
jgi:hypothetical protein